MSAESQIVSRGPSEGTVRTADGKILEVPAGWVLLPPGDAGLTRRVKAAGPTLTVKEWRRRKWYSLGVWAAPENVESARAALEAERGTEAYARKRASDLARREKKQAAYVEDFRGAVLAFLDFAPQYAELAEMLADAVSSHATPVGSGTVARTERIPIERRAEAAVIAWLRHQTTAYDELSIARIKGERREIRRRLAEKSRALLKDYRCGTKINVKTCPLWVALMSDRPPR